MMRLKDCRTLLAMLETSPQLSLEKGRRASFCSEGLSRHCATMICHWIPDPGYTQTNKTSLMGGCIFD
jgi:hypothetical protein